MKHHIKIGLIVGAVALVLNTCVSFLFGLCGPVIAVVAGAFAGFFSLQKFQGMSKKEAAKLAAISGAIVGALMIIGQVIAAVASLGIVQAADMPLILGGRPPAPGDGALAYLVYYLVGMGTGFCIGLIGLGLSSLSAYAVGYWMTSEEQPSEEEVVNVSQDDGKE